jgi:hypothetical protein
LSRPFTPLPKCFEADSSDRGRNALKKISVKKDRGGCATTGRQVDPTTCRSPACSVLGFGQCWMARRVWSCGFGPAGVVLPHLPHYNGVCQHLWSPTTHLRQGPTLPSGMLLAFPTISSRGDRGRNALKKISVKDGRTGYVVLACTYPFACPWSTIYANHQLLSCRSSVVSGLSARFFRSCSISFPSFFYRWWPSVDRGQNAPKKISVKEDRGGCLVAVE